MERAQASQPTSAASSAIRKAASDQILLDSIERSPEIGGLVFGASWHKKRSRFDRGELHTAVPKRQRLSGECRRFGFIESSVAETVDQGGHLWKVLQNPIARLDNRFGLQVGMAKPDGFKGFVRDHKAVAT